MPPSRQMADALVASGMDKAGYTYIIVDEGWSSYRDTMERSPAMRAFLT
jgi:hypothetical protein